ncbi:HIRAN domain-containing protein [Xanthomonas nasturtii]|uniref:HIRAN domain-containing protein n=1 Tax=Xanthomonas nasturtii TaxID=1843581 RepID=UPI0020111F5C|nr:HIRAN domain-containing protein [Xanthomonas nasturtii]MCL1561091.1 HIRAN domain-containing protein [Xanthomonas nasturtii]
MNKIFLALQEPETRSWFPVARVEKLLDSYVLHYTKGVEKFPKFLGFGRMNKLDCVYFSRDLFPLLKNRVISRNRADFSAFADWLGKDASALSAFDELAVTGGLRGTDTIELIPVPEINENGLYQASFFIHGFRYLSPSAREEFLKLAIGDQLSLVPEPENEFDGHALRLTHRGSSQFIGYVPRYFSMEFSALLKAQKDAVVVTVMRVNDGAPFAFRVLCELVAPWPEDFDSCREDEFRSLVDVPRATHVIA